jgi:hypothetical protein
MSVVPRCDLQVGRGEDVFVAGGRERDFTQVFHGRFPVRTVGYGVTS